MAGMALPLELGSSSVTVLRSGADFVVAAGLCGWLRAWQLRPAELTSEEVCTAHGRLLASLVATSPHTDILLSLSLSLHPRHQLVHTTCLGVGARTRRAQHVRPAQRTHELPPVPVRRAGLTLTLALALALALAPTLTLTLTLTRCVAVADGELAASTTHAEGHIQVWG